MHFVLELNIYVKHKTAFFHFASMRFFDSFESARSSTLLKNIKLQFRTSSNSKISNMFQIRTFKLYCGRQRNFHKYTPITIHFTIPTSVN